MYFYVGDSEILFLVNHPSQRGCIRHTDDVLRWLKNTGQTPSKEKSLTVTFIIDTDHNLWINDRYSEHVLCAGGKPVLSAGEMTFTIHNQDVTVIEVTNQSTGYCPEPSSWQFVEKALDKIGIAHPGDFTTKFLFRRCNQCDTTNIVKDDWFFCGVCDTPLHKEWNYNNNRRIK